MADTRTTLPTNGNFYKILVELFEQKKKADILYEDGGVTRGSGIVTNLFERDGKNWLQLDDTFEVSLDKLYAVNGTFTSDYTEC
ncbi:hypothetical protein LX64_00807 [Chitinophaga skermanii]|uniref:Uncharacterized protein n=1 Tax=Chitinophaga skermanii TaxID=331697 RepID=A0A327R525_9BACT|nr:hypothetical protein [Chitinophaga skermanii]RAJ11198.1 hypothetical protein LX64_00807 [Chitinophaga skermanii]